MRAWPGGGLKRPSHQAPPSKSKQTKKEAAQKNQKAGCKKKGSYFSQNQKRLSHAYSFSGSLLFCFPAQSAGKGPRWGHIFGFGLQCVQRCVNPVKSFLPRSHSTLPRADFQKDAATTDALGKAQLNALAHVF